MKNVSLKIFLAAALLLLPLLCGGQAKIYTRSTKMADLQTKTTKMVLSGNAALDEAFQDEVAVRWVLNPFEFCTEKEYEKLKTSNESYFLRFTVDEGVLFLSYSKGGKDSDADRMKQPFDIVWLPIGDEDLSTGYEIEYLGYFLDIIQTFAESAMTSDKIAYAGLKHYNNLDIKGRHLEALNIFPAGSGKYSYTLLLDRDTHELCRFRKRPNNADSPR